MTYVELVLIAGLYWWVWDFRREVRTRVLVEAATRAAGLGEPDTAPVRSGFAGAVPPARYVVVRWPGELKFYNGCDGSAAKKMYENTAPGKGETVEFWELGSRRGYKVG